MKTSNLFGLLVLIIVIAGGWWLYAHYSPAPATTGGVTTESITTPWGLSLTYAYPGYGVAVTKDQLPS